MKSQLRYRIRTLGCKANISDSRQIERELWRQGWKPALAGEEAHLCIVNSCTVTDEADRQTRKFAARLNRENPQAVMVVTGCSAEVDPERLMHSKGIHYVIGNRDKPQLVKLILEKISQQSHIQSQDQNSNPVLLGSTRSYSELTSAHPMDREWPTVEEFCSQFEFDCRPTTRSFIKIQEGCNSFCTYCVIPYGRGPSRSLEQKKIVAAVNQEILLGVKEIVLTGTNLGDYEEGADSLLELMKRILGETDLARLRVSSLDPTEILPEMTKWMEREPRFCPHFHVSLQNVSDQILKRMKRRYSFAQVQECLERIANVSVSVPGGVFVGMDYIVGFPGETPDEFEKEYQRLEVLPWSRLHVFPYSERKGTPATRLSEVVPTVERQQRAHQLNQLSREKLLGFHQKAIGDISQARLENVLLERFVKVPRVLQTPKAGLPNEGPLEKHWIAGYTPNYLRVFVGVESEKKALENSIQAIQCQSVLEDPVASEFYLRAKLSLTS